MMWNFFRKTAGPVDLMDATPRLRALKAEMAEREAIKAKSDPLVRAVHDQIKGMRHELMSAHVEMCTEDADLVRDYLRACGAPGDGPIRLFGMPVHERESDGPPIVVVTAHG
jgi:hypothetical protein